jgi:phage gp45-like
MDTFLDTIGLALDKSRGKFAQPRIGTVSSSDSATATARVMLQPEGILSGWLPVLTQWSGSGWGIACPPSPGDQVLVICQEGNSEHGIIVGRLFSNSFRPPGAEVGEIILRHASGSSICLLNSGVIAINGDLHVSGDVYDTHGSLSRLRNNYDTHIHHTSSNTDTSVPLPQD